MKNLYLNFCKLATLVLMVGLSVIFLQVKTSQISAQSAPGNSGSIWTTNADCGASNQDVNHYDVGNHVYINGANFDEGTYDWEIKGQPGQASSDPNIVVASGSIVVGANGSFCFDAYTVLPGDDGEYKVGVGNKNDNYRVDSEEINDVCADIEGVQEVVPEGRYQDGDNCPRKIGVCTDPDASNYDSEVGPTEIADDGACQCLAAQSCPLACGQPATTVPDGQCGVINCLATQACEESVYGCTDEEATNYNAEATHDDESCVYPSSTPTPTPTPSPDPTEPPGYNCPVAQSCPSACGQAASDVPNGSCGFNHCDPTPSCDGGIGGGSQGQVLGASTMSGQVLGASTYAATGVVEDALFSLMGVAGAGLSGAGILLKRNEKRQK